MPQTKLGDLHAHIGGAVPASVLWEILCEQGLQTPHKTFQAFQKALTADANSVENLDEFLGKYFHITEAIQSSPAALSQSAYQAVAKAHRRSDVEFIEMRFNPAKRLRGGIHSIDAILLAALQGLEKASLHYNVETSAILSLGRDCSLETNTNIVEAAIRWKGHRQGLAKGIVAIDMAGSESQKLEEKPEWLKAITHLFRRAQDAGLKTTYHIGETKDSGWQGVRQILHQIRPNRIGHGVQLRNAPKDQKQRIYDILATTNTCLEICPTVNLVTNSISNIQELRGFTKELFSHQVPFTVCTDNPYLVHTNLKSELDLLFPNPSQTKEWALSCMHAHQFQN
jgi:adenosine deaminase